MGDEMGLLATLLTLLCVYAPVSGAEGCSSFRHLENGQTFFRYGGLLVIFRCRPGYKLHGYKTNSCVSGHWSRDTPVCVGSGCSDPGPLLHGTSSMNEDGSLAVFSCDHGFRLHGPSVLYCKGHTWNSTKPECRESDMMSSFVGVHLQKPNILDQNLQAAVVLKTQQQSHHDTPAYAAPRGANLKLGLLSQTPYRMSKSEKDKVTDPRVQRQSFKVEDGFRTRHHEAQHQETNEVQVPEREVNWEISEAKPLTEDKVTEMFASKSNLFTTVSSKLSLASGAELSVSSSPPFSSLQTPTITAPAVKNTLTVLTSASTSQLHQTNSAPPVLGGDKTLKSGDHSMSPDDVTTTEETSASLKAADEDQQAKTDLYHYDLSQAGSKDKEEEDAETAAFISSSSAFLISTSSPSTSSVPSSSPQLPSISTQTSTTPSSTQSTKKTHPPNPSTTTKQSSHWTERYNPKPNATSKPSLLALNPLRRPICPYPPVPAHGTFYFRNVKNPGPKEYRHYIQYACYPAYTLAHGDVYSYCQLGRWSGVTPVCLELTPCSVNNGGCSQLCSHSQHYNQSSNQTHSRTECHCRPGFTLLDDGRTCRDVDECVEQQHPCQQRCDNTFGSFKCSCDDGFQQAPDQISCTDAQQKAGLDYTLFTKTQCEDGTRLSPILFHFITADHLGLGPCKEQCLNTPGSYRCSCTRGHILAVNGHSCIPECPPGYRKQTTPENSTAQALREECVDINECQEEDRCGWQCVNQPGSYRCICPRGYKLMGDGQRCKDINECSQRNGGCSHLCVNQKGGYKCACPASHRLSPYSWKKCLLRTTENTAG